MNLRELPDLSDAYKQVQALDEKKKPKRWQDDDGDGKWYEKSDVDGKISKREKEKLKKEGADIADILARLEKKRISKGGDPEESPLPAMKKYHADKKKKVKKEEVENVDEAKVDAGKSPETKEKDRNVRKFGVSHNVAGHGKLRRALHKSNRGDKKIPGDKPYVEKESVEYDLSEDWINASVDISSDYFYSEGLNEEGVEMVIEEVGLEDFLEFVTDPIEELNEERSARKAKSNAPSYEKVKAAVDKADAAKKAAKKGEYSAAYKKKETDVTDYGDKKPAAKTKSNTRLTATVKKKPAKKAAAPKKAATLKKVEKAVSTAKKKQPAKPASKPGIVGKIKSAVKKGVERHNKAREAGKVPEKRVKEFAKGFKSGVRDTVKFAKKAKKAVVGEGVDGKHLDLTEWLSKCIDELSEDETIDEISDEDLVLLFEEAITDLTEDPDELIEMIEIIDRVQLDELVGTAAGLAVKGAQVVGKAAKQAARSKRLKSAAKGAGERIKSGLKKVGAAAKSGASKALDAAKKHGPGVAAKAKAGAKKAARGAVKGAGYASGLAQRAGAAAKKEWKAGRDRGLKRGDSSSSSSSSSSSAPAKKSGGLSKSSGAESKSKSSGDGTGGKLDKVLSNIRGARGGTKDSGSSSSSSSSSASKSSSSSGETRKAVGSAAKAVGKAAGAVAKKTGEVAGKAAKKVGGKLKSLVKKGVGKTARLVSKGSGKLAKRLGEDYERINTLIESELFDIQEIENIVLYEATYGGEKKKEAKKATPESGTGKYYKQGSPTKAQLSAREKYKKIKDLTNQGKHKEASALYKDS